MSQACLVDFSELSDLSKELGTESVARFVRAFVKMWPLRREKIHRAMCRREADAAMDALLSLRSGALMAGARALAEQTDLIRGVLGVDGAPAWGDARSLLAELDDLGERTVKTLLGGTGFGDDLSGGSR